MRKVWNVVLLPVYKTMLLPLGPGLHQNKAFVHFRHRWPFPRFPLPAVANQRPQIIKNICRLGSTWPFALEHHDGWNP